MISSLIRLLKKDRTAWKFTEPYLPDTNLSPNLSILYDVESFTYFEIDNKRIVLVGNRHLEYVGKGYDYDARGQILEDWVIGTCLANKTKCIDFFTESGIYSGKRLINPKLHLFVALHHKVYEGSMFGSGNDAIVIAKERLPNLRLHNIDLRQLAVTDRKDAVIKGDFGDKEWYWKHYFGIDSKFGYLISSRFGSSFGAPGLKELMIAYTLCTDTKWTNVAFPTKKNYKLFASTYFIGKFATDAARLLSDAFYFNGWLRSAVKLIHRQLDNGPLDKNKFFNVMITCYNHVFGSLSQFMILHMFFVDAYALSRIFRNFNRKISRNSVCKKDIKAAIVHAGDFHIRVYCSFIEKYFETKCKLCLKPVKDEKHEIIFKKPFKLFD
jgi:hypothetical protein